MSDEARKEPHPDAPTYGEGGVVPNQGADRGTPHPYDNLGEGLVIPPQPEPGVMRDEREVTARTVAAESPMGLVKQLMSEVAVLLRKEMALAASEISHSVTEAKQGAVSLAGGGAVLYAGVLFLLGAATLGLAEVMAAWLAALIVGGVVAVIGYAMLSAGRKKLSAGNFAPTRTADSVRKDRDVLTRQTS